MDLVRFFLSNARVLESVRLAVGVVNCYHKWVATQLKKLRPGTGSASSQGAKIAFENDRRGSDRVPVEHIHDLSLGDLFDRSVRE